MPSLFTACPQKSHMEMFSITIQHGFERDRRSSTLRKRVLWASLLGIFVTAQLPALVHATNGLNLIGSGGISTGLAGADTAVATDFTAMNTNPAGMSQIKENHSGLAITVIKPQLPDPEVWKPAREIRVYPSEEVHGVAFTADGRRVIGARYCNKLWMRIFRRRLCLV